MTDSPFKTKESSPRGKECPRLKILPSTSSPDKDIRGQAGQAAIKQPAVSFLPKENK
jgi:hypothetical protein